MNEVESQTISTAKPIPLTRTERLAFVGHQAREQLLAAEFREFLSELAARAGIAPEDIGKTWALDTQTWSLVPLPQPTPDPAPKSE